jgi:4-aminobutyrate aminotransferase-like enzyme
VLIADEIQGGMARTGKLFSIEHSGVVPDLITTAKGLAGGFPLAGVTGKATLMDVTHVGGLGGTYAGSPVVIAAALTVMDVIVTENLCERATRIGERIRASMEKLAHSLPPLTISDEHLEEGLDILEAALRAAASVPP